MRDLPRGTQVVDLEAARFAYGAVTRYGLPFLTVRLTISFVTPAGPCRVLTSTPTTPTQKRLLPITLSEFGLFPFRSPLLRE
jgi:hypothetical protein